jgi:hypothetical protein
MPRSSRLAVLVLIAAALVAGGAVAQPMPRPITVRLEGYVGPPPERRHELADLHLRADRVDVRFQVTNAFITQGRATTTSMFAELRPRRPSLTLRGTPELVAMVAGAAEGTRLRMLGNWRRGSRDFFLSSVEEIAPAGATPGRNSGSRTQDAGSGP